MDRRRMPRLGFTVAVQITPLGYPAPTLFACTRDICMAGLCVDEVAPLPPGTRCELRVLLHSGDLTAQIRATGRVVRAELVAETHTGSMGIAFTALDDDSQELLWRVLRHNSPAAAPAPAAEPPPVAGLGPEDAADA